MSAPSASRPARNSKTAKRIFGHGTDTPDPIDVHVGARLRLRRQELDMSQEKVAEGLGLTFQQVQKYERGKNRLGASRLYDLARVLNTTIAYFFEGLPRQHATRHQPAVIINNVHFNDPMMRSESHELVRAYYQIPDERIRRRLYFLVKATAAGEVK